MEPKPMGVARIARLVIGLVLVIGSGSVTVTRGADADPTVIYRGVSTAVQFDVSPPLTELAQRQPTVAIIQKRDDDRDPPTGLEGPFGPQDVDPLVQGEVGLGEIPAPSVSFDTLNNATTGTPPDPVGAVGPSHYVVMDNAQYAVYSKTGVLLAGPANINTLWAGFGGACQNENAGDPIVLYDRQADRWLLTQFTAAGPTFFNCVALSQTADPTGAYYRWAFSTGTNFPDYPKYGHWPDAYYISTREFAGASFAGVGAYALNRTQMIAGNPAPQIISFLATPGATPYRIGDGLLPSDLDGSTLPPAGTPNFYIGTQDNGGPYGAPSDALNVWKFHVDFATPSNSTFTLANTVAVAAFDSIFPCAPGSRDCIPQPGTTQKLDHLGYRQRPLHRAAYRNFGTHEAIVTNQSVEATPGISGIRWWELRSPNASPTIYQEGTYAPGDGVHRWMGSIAQDRQGNMALGFSASNASVFPGVRYTGRLVGDPLGTMPQGEGTFINGLGSQTGSARWGDYTAMTVDPVDDCTFWYVNEYYPTTSSTGWRLRVGAFKFPSCSGQTPAATLVSPTGTIGTTMPTYTWNAVAQADSYYLWVNDSSGPAKVTQWIGPATAGCASGTGTCSFTPGTNLATGAATWWIQTWSVSLGYGPWSAPLYFTIATPAATLVAPSGVIGTRTPTYTWNAVAQADSYYLWVNDSTGPAKVTQWIGPGTAGCPAGTGTCSFNPGTNLATGAATWWIRTWSVTLGYGPWSAPLYFTIAPPGATLVSPTGNITTNQPTYIWNAVALADSYYLWVNDAAGPGKITQWIGPGTAGCASGTGMCSFTPGTALAAGAATWWIQTWSVSLGYGPWSAPLNFTVPGAGPTTYPYTGAPVPIPDNNPAGATASIVVPGSFTVSDINLTLTNISHTFIGDLVVQLIAPDGTTITMLSNIPNGTGSNASANFTNTILDDEAVNPIQSQAGAVTNGSFRPASPLSGFDGRAGNGTWTLKIIDNQAQDSGTITAWSITITPQ